ncbi:hypothetical protein SmJEL517_g00639 [Synchytrium microbalum]|uniref:Geranylgeranyl pyrophosphate synthase n=1 Tax=Synchytrium microbalum TaxID=1806994 RepID=A0A507CDX1_9FUNG|nr:uncharacterized protein SmJEL517_g00639 [Synchytrium microbalum]TPX37538.1 hypothetical protein SmJEL517_g00639 [Synchytrium microbalum]
MMATPYLEQVTESDQLLLEPFAYLCQYPGKEIRTKLIEAFDHWIRVPPQKLEIIKKVVEMLHTSSLLIDDVEDDSSLRRGVPVAHKIYGIPATINCANYVYFIALQKALTLNDPRAVEIFTEELIQLHRGQGMDIHWRDTATCPTEDQYLEMVGNKTGGLLRLAVKLMEIAANCQTDYVPLVNILGVHFQVRDDLMNLTSAKYTDNKGFCEDLTEGKFSFPIIHCIRSTTNNHQMINILKQKTTDVDVKRYAVRLMDETQSFEYTKSYLRRVEKQALSEIQRLGGNPYLDAVMKQLAVQN